MLIHWNKDSARFGQFIKYTLFRSPFSPLLVPFSATEGPLLVPISLKIRSPFSPHFDKFRSPFHVGAVQTVEIRRFLWFRLILNWDRALRYPGENWVIHICSACQYGCRSISIPRAQNRKETVIAVRCVGDWSCCGRRARCGSVCGSAALGM